MELFQDKKDKKDCTLDMGRGCEFCGCGGEELSAGVCEGCFKLHVTDWLKDYPDTLPGDIYEVRFKNTPQRILPECQRSLSERGRHRGRRGRSGA